MAEPRKKRIPDSRQTAPAPDILPPLALPQQPQQLPDPTMMGAMPPQPAMVPPGLPAMGAGHDNMQGMSEGLNASVGLDGPSTPGAVFQPTGSRITKEILFAADRTMAKYKAGKAKLEKRIVEAQQWWRLRNWVELEKDGIKGSHSTKSNTAWLWNCVVGKHADAIDAYPEALVLPRMGDDKEEADKLSAIVPVVMAINGFEQTYSDCAWQKMLEGTGAYGVYWDKDKLNGLGDISIKKVNLLNLFWEPGIDDIQDSRNVFHVALVDNSTLVQMYPQLKGQQLGKKQAVTTYIYDDSVDTTDKSLVVDWYYHAYYGPKKVLHYCKYVGEHVLYATEDDPACMERGLYDDGLYPFVLDVLFPVEGSPAGFGYVHVGKDTQKDIDLISQAVVTNAVVNATPRFFVRKDGAANEDEFGDLTKPFVHVNGQLGQDTIMPITAPNLPSNAINVLTAKIDELKFVTGNTDVNNGGTPSGVTAASAIAALREQSGRSSADSNKAAYRAYARVVAMVIERIRQFYDVERQFRILGPRGEETFVSYSNVGLVPQPQGVEFGVDMGYRLPAFDLDIRPQRENAYTRASQNELALQLYQLGIFNPQAADSAVMLLDMMDFKGKDELVQKIQRNGTLMMALQQMVGIASTLAMQTGDQQAAAMIQQIGMQMGAAGALPMGGMGAVSMPAGDPLGSGVDDKKHPFVEKAERQVQEASRPS